MPVGPVNSNHKVSVKARTKHQPPVCEDAQRLAGLVKRCLRGDDRAWEQLVNDYWPILLGVVRELLGRRGLYDSHLVEEIVSRVLFALVANDGQLLSKFDPGQSSFSTFLAGLAKIEIARYVRGEIRRREREREVRSHHPGFQRPELSLEIAMEDLAGQLTPTELEFFHDYLLSSDNRDYQEQMSQSKIYQLRYRIRRKLLSHLYPR